MKRVLMIAFHFPPVAMGSGHLRTLGFARYLPSLGWEPTILSANAAAFPRVDAANLDLIPPGCRVHRAFSLDVRRHLSIRGKYPQWLAQPDGWASWWPAAVVKGLGLIRKHKIDVIWSTYPIMTAHCVANTLSRLTGLPWIADFRDPVASSVEAGNRFSVASQARCERRVLAHAACTVFTTPGAMRSYAENYPVPHRGNRLAVIPNGYDEATFSGLPAAMHRQPRRPLRLVHSGILYREGRDPLPFFTALENLRRAGELTEQDLTIVLRASGSESTYEEEIRRRGLERMISLAPPISNQEALREQAEADALLLFQGEQYDRQIPAKVYEYLRTGHPILALVSSSGDTAALLREAGGAQLVSMNSVPAIEASLVGFVRALIDGRAPAIRPGDATKYSRRESSIVLAKLLDKVSSGSRDTF